jgi:hypothetical protein
MALGTERGEVAAYRGVPVAGESASHAGVPPAFLIKSSIALLSSEQRCAIGR